MAEFGAALFANTLNTTVVPAITGIEFTWYRATQHEIEPGPPGVYTWTVLDAAVNAAIAAGIRPCIKTNIDTDDALDVPPTAPADLLQYTNWITAVATHYLGRVSTYAIQNELDMPNHVPWTAATYVTVRTAAYAAIKAVDPTAIVLDSAITEVGYAVYWAQEQVTAGNAETALMWLMNWADRCRGDNLVVPHTLAALTVWLALPENVRKRAFVTDLLTNGNYDALQIHYMSDAWEYVPEFMGRIQAWFPGVDLHVWESAYSWDTVQEGDTDDWEEDNHAAGIMRTMIGLAGMGAIEVCYLPYRDWPPPYGTAYPFRYQRGLVNLAYTEYHAAAAYETMAALIGGVNGVAVAWGTGVHAYRFGTLYAAWAERRTHVNLAALAAFADEARIYNIYGATKHGTARNVTLGPMPVYLESYDAPIRDGWVERQ